MVVATWTGSGLASDGDNWGDPPVLNGDTTSTTITEPTATNVDIDFPGGVMNHHGHNIDEMKVSEGNFRLFVVTVEDTSLDCELMWSDDEFATDASILTLDSSANYSAPFILQDGTNLYIFAHDTTNSDIVGWVIDTPLGTPSIGAGPVVVSDATPQTTAGNTGPAGTIDDDGYVYVIWVDNTDDIRVQVNQNNPITSAAHLATSQWFPDRNFSTAGSQDYGGNGGTMEDPNILSDDQGNLLLVWEESGTVYSQFKSETSTFSGTGLQSFAGTAQVSVTSAHGDPRTVGVVYLDGSSRPRFREHGNFGDGPWSAEEVVSTSGSRNMGAVGHNGDRFVAISWQSLGGDFWHYRDGGSWAAEEDLNMQNSGSGDNRLTDIANSTHYRARPHVTHILAAVLATTPTSIDYKKIVHDGTGGSGPGGVPNETDSVIFDDTSVSNCTWDIAEVIDIDIQAGYTGTITMDAGATRTISGNLTKVAGGTLDLGSASVVIGGDCEVDVVTGGTSNATLQGASNNVKGTGFNDVTITGNYITTSNFSVDGDLTVGS